MDKKAEVEVVYYLISISQMPTFVPWFKHGKQMSFQWNVKGYLGVKQFHKVSFKPRAMLSIVHLPVDRMLWPKNESASKLSCSLSVHLLLILYLDFIITGF